MPDRDIRTTPTPLPILFFSKRIFYGETSWARLSSVPYVQNGGTLLLYNSRTSLCRTWICGVPGCLEFPFRSPHRHWNLRMPWNLVLRPDLVIISNCMMFVLKTNRFDSCFESRGLLSRSPPPPQELITVPCLTNMIIINIINIIIIVLN